MTPLLLFCLVISAGIFCVFIVPFIFGLLIKLTIFAFILFIKIAAVCIMGYILWEIIKHIRGQK